MSFRNVGLATNPAPANLSAIYGNVAGFTLVQAHLGWIYQTVRSLAEQDSDLDGRTDEAEFLAGTDPYRAPLAPATYVPKPLDVLLQNIRILLERAVSATAEAQLAKGRSVILGATFVRREHRQLLAERFERRNINWRLLEAHASNAAVKHRLRVRESSPDEVSDARLEDFTTLTGLYKPPVEVTSGHHAKVSTSGPLDQTVTKALQSLARIQVDSPRPSS